MISLSVCVSACLCLCLSAHKHISRTTGPILANFLCRSPVAVVRSSSGGVVIHYILPVLWMTSHLVAVGRMAMHGRLNL